jgi:anti-sigma factor RsiW
MKDFCQDMTSLLARAADEDLATADRARLDAHLSACAPCRDALEMQRAVSGLLKARADGLRVTASDALRSRIAGRIAPRRRPAFSPFRMPVAATVLLTVLVLGTYGLTSASSTVLAAQLALDHLKCVKLVQDAEGGIDPARAGREWEQTYTWSLDVPAPPADISRLVGVRRCLYGHGHLAHLLYDVNGEVVSLFVMPRAEYQAQEQTALGAILGQQTRVWADGDQTFALVARGESADLDVLERHFRGRS